MSQINSSNNSANVNTFNPNVEVVTQQTTSYQDNDDQPPSYHLIVNFTERVEKWNNNEEKISSEENNDSKKRVIFKQPLKKEANIERTTSPDFCDQLDKYCTSMLPLTCFCFSFCMYLDGLVKEEELEFRCSKYGVLCLPCDFVLLSLCCPLLCLNKSRYNYEIINMKS